MKVDQNHVDFNYIAPKELKVTPAPVRNVLLTGSCLISNLIGPIATLTDGCGVDHILFNHPGDLPSAPPKPIEQYDFQVV